MMRSKEDKRRGQQGRKERGRRAETEYIRGEEEGREESEEGRQGWSV